MSDRVVQPDNDANKRSKQTLQPYQSVWLAHWMRTSCDAAGETSCPNASGNEELDYVTRNDGLTKGSEDSSGSVKGLGMIKTRTFEIGDDIIKISSKSIGNERILSSLFKDGHDTDDMQALRPEFADNLERGKAVDCKSGIQFPSLISGIPAANGIPPRGCHSLGEVTSNNPPNWMRTLSAGKDSMFESNPLQETLSSSHIVPYRFNIEKYEFDKGQAAVSPLVSRSTIVSKQSRSANVRMLEHEQSHEHMHSADLVCERKVDCPSQSDNSLDACFRERYLSTLGRGWFPEMQKCSGIRLFPSQCISSAESETKKSRNDCYSLLKLQNCVHDVETMRICTTVDALGGMPEDRPRFSQTTNGLLIAKKTDVNALKENDMFRSTTLFTKSNGNISSELHCLSPFFGQGKQQVKLQPLSSLIDSEVKENIRDVKVSKVTIRNEASAETDTMDVDSSKEKNSKRNLHSGSNSTTSTKAFHMESSIPPWSDVTSSREVGHGRPKNKLPDINLELPALPGATSSSENMRPSPSKTQNLEMEKLLEHVEQPKPKPNISLDDFSNADPGNRWVKRLKLSSSNSSAQGTKSSNFASSSSHEKTSQIFSSILKSSITSSAPTLRKHHRKKSVLSDRSGDFSEKDEDHLMENSKDKGKALLLSKAWIQRLLHNGRRIAEKRPEPEVFCEPESLKLTLEKLQKERLPSIAAMALMGKALTCFQPCVLQKRGPFTVWNTKTF